MADDAGSSAPPTLRDVLQPLRALPVQQQSFSARQLLSCLDQLEDTQQQLLNRKPPNEETIGDQDSILLSWLSGIVHGISGSQAIIHGELLQPEITASGMVAPFVQPVPPLPSADGQVTPSSGARFGVPSKTDVLCDNVSELVRMAAAAVISLYVYLNFRQGPGDLPADEVALTFATVAIHSCASASTAAVINQQIQAVIDNDIQCRGEASVWWKQQQKPSQESTSTEAQDEPAIKQQQFGCAHIRWLMHYVRGLVAHYMAAVQHVLGNRKAQADCYHAQQKDMQYMCKTLPNHPLGYSLLSRCAMNGQQMKMAQLFLSKGLDVAKQVGADTSIATMSYQQVGALLLGGNGPKVDAAAVQLLLQEGQAARETVLGWFPAPWRAAAEDGDPDRHLVLQKLLPELEKRSGAPLPADGEVDALSGILYVTRPEAAVPAGAVQYLVDEGVEVVQQGSQQQGDAGE